METSDFLTYITDFIKHNDYPLIHTMNPEEIAQVFNKQNRSFLVSWAFSLLDKDCYGEVLSGREQDKCLLADLVYHHGFCMDKEKLGFLNGDLPLEEQLSILYRMFKFIESLKKESTMQENFEMLSMDDLFVLKSMDLNLFPALGEMKCFTQDERQTKIAEIMKKAEKLKLAFTETKEEKGTQKISDIKREYIKDIVMDINDNLSKLDKVMKDVSRETSIEEKPNYEIDLTFVDLVETCNKYMKTVTQYIADLQVINEFKIKEIPMPLNEVSLLVGLLAKQAQGLADL